MTQLNVPFQIPGYRIVRRLGMGGMATVYLAVQESLKRPVAVKVLATERAPSDELARRFEHEARTIARLDHPHIVSIYDVGRTSNGQIYYTMPYFPNGDLSMRNLRDQPKRVLEVMRALTEALACAHDKGIVHRDVKPENVLFDKQDRPQLADFGIALSNSHQPRMTREGATIGSSGYMSPEQARGQPLDGRSDFYSLGVVCYELLTGERPFQGTDALAVALAHIEKPVPRLPVTRRLWQPLIDRALAKQPDARFQSAEELLAAIAVVERRLQMRRRRGASRYWIWLVERTLAVSRKKRALALGVLLAAILAGLLALLPRVPQRAAVPDTTAAPTPVDGAIPMPGIATPAGQPAADGQAPVVAAPVPLDNAAPPSADATEPMPTERADRLRLAASLVVLGHVSSPPGNNAADQYLAVLAAEPHQRDAVKGIERILAALSLRAANAIAEDDPRSAIEPIAQANVIAERANMKARPAFAAFVAPIHDAVQKRRERAHDPFDPSIAAMTPLLPLIERIDPAQARALKADLDRPAELLRDGGTFRDPGGPTLAVITRSRASAGHVDRPFAIATTDVTRGAYAKFAAASGRSPSTCRESQSLLARLSRGLDWRAPGFTQTDDHPAVCISWDDADAYAQWLGKRTGARYRLPTAQEWLVAAQPAGADTGCRKANIDHGRKCDDGYPHTAPVGRFAATAPGLYDIAGNVSVWIDGCAGGPGGDRCSERTFRGLSWHDDGDESNLVRSDHAASNIGYANVGFRLVRELAAVKD